MHSDTYQRDALRTRSELYRPGLIGQDELGQLLTRAIASGNLAKMLKRIVYTNKSDGSTGVGPTFSAHPMSGIPAIIPAMPDLLHAVLGILNEAGEIAGFFVNVLQSNQTDRVNLVEELGDLLWFIALGCEAVGVPLSEVMARNIAKLKVRYPEKFTTEAFENRDLDKEREAVTVSPPVVTPVVALPYLIDEDRLHRLNGDGSLCQTGMYVRAQHKHSLKFENADIIALELGSLLRWLRSRGEKNRWAESCCAMLLGHDGADVGKALDGLDGKAANPEPR